MPLTKPELDAIKIPPERFLPGESARELFEGAMDSYTRNESAKTKSWKRMAISPWEFKLLGWCKIEVIDYFRLPLKTDYVCLIKCDGQIAWVPCLPHLFQKIISNQTSPTSH